MSISETVQDIIDNQQGGTVSASWNRSDLPAFGYWVGGAGPCLVIPPATGAANARLVIRSFLAESVASYFCWWTDAEDGKFYLDCVTWAPDVDKAQRLAAERGEIAFWDIEADAEIRTEA